jgi:hypothetical protein
MEDEGIMGLPPGQAMQNPAPPQQPVVSSADSYDAALSGLGLSQNGPGQVSDVKRAVQDAIGDLDLSASEVAALLDVLEYMSQNPDEYPQLRQRLIDSGMMDDDDLPPAYDPEYLGMAIMVLNEYRDMRSAGAQAPMQMAPEVENLGPMPMAEGGLADVASYLASQGRNGDTMLAHITPAEARLLKAMGGSGTINPRTGLPEFFLKKIFKKVKKAVKSLLKNPIVRVIATVALATVLGPAAASIGMSTAAATATASVVSSAAVSAMAGEKLNAKNLLINAATSYFGAGGTIGGVNPVSSIAKLASRIPGVTEGGKLAQGIGSGLTSAAIGKAAGMSTEEALGMGLQQGVMAGLTYKPEQTPVESATGQGPTQAAPGQQAPIQRGIGELPPSDYVAAPEQVATTAPGAVGTAASGEVAGKSFLDRLNPFSKLPDDYPVDAATGAPVNPAQTFTGRLNEFANMPSFQTFKDAFLVNPYAKTELGRYVPAALTTMGVGALTGGFKTTPANENPLFNRNYTGADYIRDNPNLFGGALGRVEGMPQSYDPFVRTQSPSMPPGSQIPIYTPRGATMMPTGVPQPYNVAGLYGVPDLSAPVQQPTYPVPGYAKGGDPKPTHFPRKTGPINGPGTGTSDSIPAMLSDGEFVFTAKAVRNAGGGSRRKGAKRMYALMKKLEGGPVKG